MHFAAFVALALLAALTTGCAAIGRAARGTPPTYAEAAGAPISAAASVPPGAFALDWPAEDRATLKAIMRREIALARVENGRVMLLTECAVPGSYDVAELSPEVGALTRSDAWGGRADVGVAGVSASHAESLQAAVSVHGRALALGTDGAPRKLVTSGEIAPRCESATHYVSSALIGGFARSSTVAGRARASGGLLALEADTGSSSASFEHGAAASSPLRIELRPVVAEPVVRILLVGFTFRAWGPQGERWDWDADNQPDPRFRLWKNGELLWVSGEFSDQAEGAPNVAMGGEAISVNGMDRIVIAAHDVDSFGEQWMGEAVLGAAEAAKGEAVTIPVRGAGGVEVGKLRVAFERR